MANYRIEDVEGIGPARGGKFRAAGVKNIHELLANTATPAQRRSLSEKTGLEETRILKFANMADLYRIKGIGSQYTELLEASGVDTVPELAARNAENLAQAMAALNQSKKLVRRPPTAKMVARWIAQAKALPRALQY